MYKCCTGKQKNFEQNFKVHGISGSVNPSSVKTNFNDVLQTTLKLQEKIKPNEKVELS